MAQAPWPREPGEPRDTLPEPPPLLEVDTRFSDITDRVNGQYDRMTQRAVITARVRLDGKEHNFTAAAKRYVANRERSYNECHKEALDDLLKQILTVARSA